MSTSYNEIENPLKLVDFSDFPVNEHFPQIEGKLFIADNINIDEKFDKEMLTHKHRGIGIPFQLSMNIVFVCIQGHVKLKINLQEYKLESNMVATLLVGAFMEIQEFSPDFKGGIVAINPDFINYGEDVKMGMEIFRHTADMPLFRLDDERMKEAMTILKQLKKKLQNKSFMFREQIARAYLDILRYEGYQSFYEKTQIAQGNGIRNRKDEIFTQFIKAVRKYYREERQVLFYADKLCISPKYLSSVIHDCTGKYATQWIDDYVIMDAKALLKTSTSTIKEICAILHFSNQSLFAKYFKQHTGMTPKEFRNS